MLSSAVGLVVLHIVRADLSPQSDRISQYANGPYGSVMTAVFLALGFGVVALGLGLAMTRGVTRVSVVVVLALVGAGAGLVVSGLYATDPAGAPTTAERVHSLASGAASVALISAAVVWSVLRRHRRPRPALGPAAALACAAVVLGVVSILLHDTVWAGLGQRLLWLTLMAWLLLTAWQLDGGGREQRSDLTRRPSGTVARPTGATR